VTTSAERGSGDFGSLLKAARDKRGVSLRHISTATKIPVAALEALERNDISRLPGGIFSRAFVRSYALEVGLDPDATIERFVEQFPEASVAAGHALAEQQQEEEEHDSNQQTAATFVRLIAVSVPIVAGLLYFGTVARRTEPPREQMRTDPPPPPALATPTVAPDVPARSAGSSPAAPGPGASAAVSGTPAAASGSSAGGATAPPASSDPAERVTVAVVAIGPCWVSAIVDGERVVAREFQSGERISFEVGRSVVLTAGDAAAVAVTINGEEARPLGTAGQVVTVRVTPTNFKEYLSAP
jgi:cytoskeleton protein RodZ